MIPLESFYDYKLVLLSVLVIMGSSYVALATATRLNSAHSKISKWAWLLGFGVSLGTGIWSMHFIASLALTLPVTVYYDPWITLLSLLIVIVIITVGASPMRRGRKLTNKQIISSGATIGMGIVATHYIGMAAMRMSARMEYSHTIIIIAALITFIVACVAVIIVNHFAATKITQSGKSKIAASAVIGLAASVMHYTAVYGVTFFSADQAANQSRFALNPFLLAAMLILLTTIIQGWILTMALLSESRSMENPTDSHAVSINALRVRFLIPIIVSVSIIFGAAVVGIAYYNTEDNKDSYIQTHLTQMHLLYEHMFMYSLRNDTEALRALLHSVSSDRELERLFAARDREGLLAHGSGLYSKLNKEFEVTHFYLTLPDRVNLLRFHTPARYGDIINRQTTLQAERNDAISCGIELGVLGTLTQRCVMPWHDSQTGKLIGYLELGKEIDRIVEQILASTDMMGFTLLYKRYLDEKQWADGMKSLGRENSWHKLPDVILIGEAGSFQELLQHHNLIHQDPPYQIQVAGRSYRPLALPLTDIRGEQVGDLVIMIDVTYQVELAQRALFYMMGALILLGIPLILFLSAQTRGISQILSQDELELKTRAYIDQLTSLISRRRFDELLRTEMERAHRFGVHLSLLMIDIDHFKEVNDTYGHLQGDVVLSKIGHLLRAEVRSLDIPCRYGGEELVVIMPETDKESSMLMAERIRQAISETDFRTNGKGPKSVTVSIGVASFTSDNAEEPMSLVLAADEALYKAKNNGRNRVCG